MNPKSQRFWSMSFAEQGVLHGVAGKEVPRRASSSWRSVAAWLVVFTAVFVAVSRGNYRNTMSSCSDAPHPGDGTPVFYNYPLAFNPAKARLALEEKGLKYVEKKIDLFNGQSLEPWYLKLNPSGTSPTLVAGDLVLTESMEIIKWVDQQGAPLGGDSVDRAFVSEWLKKVDAWDGNLFVMANSSAGGVVKFSTKFKIKVAEANAKRNPELADVYTKKIGEMNRIMNEPADTLKVQSNLKQLEALLDEAEARLSSSKFLAGEEYSAADAIFTPVLFRVSMAKNDEFIASKTNIQRYYEELKKRPSFKKVFCVSNSGVAKAGLVLPALGKIFLSKVTGKY